MNRKNNLIHIRTTTTTTTTNTSNYSSTEYLYTSNQLWQIKDRVDQDRTLGTISPEIVNSIRKLKLQNRKTRGNRGGTKRHYSIPAKKRSININNIIQCKPTGATSCDRELRKNLGLSLINIRSIKNKHTNLLDNLVENKTDICIVTETWLTDDDKVWLDCSDLSKNGYHIQSANRRNRRGGGLAIIAATNIKTKLLEKGEKISFEYAVWKVNTNNTSMTVLAIYHPPPSQANHSTNTVFLDEFADYLENFLTINKNVVIAGDFNLHIDNDEDPVAQLFINMMDAMGLDCHVDFPTHENGHSLDLIFTEMLSETKIIRCTLGAFMSDHCTIECLLSFKKSQQQEKEIKYRHVGMIDPRCFSQLLELDGYEELQLDGMVEVLDNNLRRAIDSLAPLKTRNIIVRPTNPWFDNEIREQKKIMRKQEKKWRRCKMESDLKSFN